MVYHKSKEIHNLGDKLGLLGQQRWQKFYYQESPIGLFWLLRYVLRGCGNDLVVAHVAFGLQKLTEFTGCLIGCPILIL